MELSVSLVQPSILKQMVSLSVLIKLFSNGYAAMSSLSLSGQMCYTCVKCTIIVSLQSQLERVHMN